MFFGLGSSRGTFEHLSAYFARWPFGILDWLANVILISAVLLAFRHVYLRNLRKQSKANTDAQTATTQYRLLDDAALAPAELDEFERAGFVATLSRTVVLPARANSLVIALESAWGSGKSSVLGLLVKELEKHPDQPLIVKFNPWLATGHERISRAFLSQFSAALLDEGERHLALRLVGFAEALEDLFPPSARMFSRIGLQPIRRIVGRMPIVDLEEKQAELRNAVVEVNRPIVVIIDDVDRLQTDDIRTVFQLVKAVAAFPRTAYLLAFDSEPIDRALSYDDTVESGRQFRDKIVQANIVLPRIRPSIRKKYFLNRLRERFSAWKVELSKTDEQLLDSVLPIVLGALQTPRDMKRVLNKTLLGFDNLRGEVCFADVLVLETIHAKWPKIVEAIRRKPSSVDPSGYGDEEVTESVVARMVSDHMNERKSKGDALKEFVSLYLGDTEYLTSLLEFAFPSVFVDAFDTDDDAAGAKRVSVHENLLKYLYQGVHGELPSAQSAEQFLGRKLGRSEVLDDAVELGTLPTWLAHIRRFAKTAVIDDPVDLAESVVLAVNAQYATSGVDTSAEARRVLISVLETLPEGQKISVLKVLLGREELASVGEEVLTSLLRARGMWHEGRYLGVANATVTTSKAEGAPQPAALDELRVLWLQTVRSVGVKALAKYPNAGGVLFRWGQLAEPPYVELTDRVADALGDEQFALDFIKLFPPGTSLSGVEKFLTADSCSKLQKVLGSHEIARSTQQKFREYFEQHGLLAG